MNKDTAKRSVFLIIIGLFFSGLIFISNNILWDSAVYVNMGKYIYSFGQSGLWEESRPLLWPIILGFFWKIGLEPIFFGKITSLIFAAGCVYLTYLIGKRIFNPGSGLLASLFLAFSPVFFLAVPQMLTAVPSTFFGLTAVYLILRKRYFFSGLFCGFAFMTRFFQVFIFVFLSGYLFFTHSKKKALFVNGYYFVLGFLILLIPYLLFNFLAYGNVFLPFILQMFLTRYTGWLWWQSPWFYLGGLIRENLFFVFALVGSYLILRDKNKEGSGILVLLLVMFISYSISIHKEMRFLISFLPYLYMIAAYGVIHLLKLVRKKNIILGIIVCIFLLQAFSQYHISKDERDYTPFWDYLNSEKVKEGIWISNPLFMLDSDKKSELIYYPSFDIENIGEKSNKILKAQHILFNVCDTPCPPWEKQCELEKEKFINLLRNNFELVYYKEEGCAEYIFTDSVS